MTAVAKTYRSLPSHTQTGSYVQKLPFDSFKTTCSNTRVSKAWKEMSDNLLSDCLQLMRSSGPLHYYDADITEGERAPETIQDVRDLKRRYVEVLEFSPDFAVFEDIPRAVMIARCARIVRINGSQWMGFYSMHIPIFTQIERTLYSISYQRKIAIFEEGSYRENGGAPIRGYVFGLEEQFSQNLGQALVSHYHHSQWLEYSQRLPKSNNGAIVKDQKLLDMEYSILNTAMFPFNLFFPKTLDSLSPQARYKYVDIIKTDRVLPSLVRLFNDPPSMASVTTGQNKDFFIQLMASHKDMLFSLLKLVALDMTDQLIAQGALSARDRVKIEKYLDLPVNYSKFQYEEAYIKPEILIELRNKMWKESIELSSPFIPKDVPRVLFGGSAHITKMLKFIQRSTTEVPVDKKEDEGPLMSDKADATSGKANATRAGLPTIETPAADLHDSASLVSTAPQSDTPDESVEILMSSNATATVASPQATDLTDTASFVEAAPQSDIPVGSVEILMSSNANATVAGPPASDLADNASFVEAAPQSDSPDESGEILMPGNANATVAGLPTIETPAADLHDSASFVGDAPQTEMSDVIENVPLEETITQETNSSTPVQRSGRVSCNQFLRNMGSNALSLIKALGNFLSKQK